MEENNNIKKIDSVKLAKDRGFDVQLSKLLEKNIRGCILINKEKYVGTELEVRMI